MGTKRNKICTFALGLCACWALFIPATAAASTVTIPAGSGTLSYNLTVVQEECSTILVVGPGDMPDAAGEEPYDISTYSSFSYSVSGTTIDFAGTLVQIVGPGANGTTCPGKVYPSTTFWAPDAEIFFATSTVFVGEGTATVATGATGFVNPKYVVVGVTYAPPGPSSSVTYTDSTLVGNTTTTTGSFQNDLNVTISVTDDISAWSVIGGGAVKVTGTESTDVIQGSNSSSTVTMSKTSTVAYQTKGTANACAPVNHDYDTIWLWLNPLVVYTVFPGSTYPLQWNGYGYDRNDPSGTEGRDVVPIEVGYLNGDFGSDPAINAILARAWVTTYEPGMVWPAGQGPGITSADITNILAADPFTSASYTLPTPLPSSSADGRYTQDPYPPNPIPYVPGETTTMYSTADVNTQSEANGTSYTYKQAFGTEEQFSGGIFGDNFTLDIKTTDTLTWAYTWLNTLTVTQTNTNALSVAEPPTTCSPPYAGPGQFIVLQDNHYGTFMFYPEI
jgi:hypothetical protein